MVSRPPAQQKEDKDGPIRVLIVDDLAMFRDSLRAVLNSDDGLQIVGEACDGAESIYKTQELSPDVVVMELAMPNMDGMEATRKIVRLRPETRVLVVTQYEDREHVLSAIKAGASGYISKRAPGADIVSAIRTVFRGEPAIYAPVASALVRDYALHTYEEKPCGGLSDGQQRVLKLVAQGYTSRQIGDRLAISVKTVQDYRRHIRNKLGLHSHTDLVRYAMRKGLVEIGMSPRQELSGDNP